MASTLQETNYQEHAQEESGTQTNSELVNPILSGHKQFEIIIFTNTHIFINLGCRVIKASALTTIPPSMPQCIICFSSSISSKQLER